MKDSDIQLVSRLLKQFEPGFLPYPIFEQVARLVALPILEYIPLRTRGGVVEVLLIKRPDDDPIWPGMMHTPGTVIRATDLQSGRTADWAASKRIMIDELAGTNLGQPHFVGSQLHASKRGVEQAQIFWTEVTGEPKTGTFYPINNLPANLIDSQVTFIEQAGRQYQANKP